MMAHSRKGVPIVSGAAFNPNGFVTLFTVGIPLCLGLHLSARRL